MGLEKFRIHDDVKWAHPELEQALACMEILLDMQKYF